MIKVEFQYKGHAIEVQTNLKEKMKKIFQKFIIKAAIDENSVYYLYNAKRIDDKELELEKIIGRINLNSTKIIIIANPLYESEEKNINSINISNIIICPECKENCMININDYKISLFNCKNGHNIDNIFLSDYERTQSIDLSKIKCDQCKDNDKGNTYNNEFYRCLSCKMNLCPLCKNNHDKSHKIINYEKKYYICETHNDLFIKYCNDCKKDLCLYCLNSHKPHNFIPYENIIPKMDELKNEMIKLRKSIDDFENEIKDIVDKLNKVKENIEVYYKIYNDMINNYENQYRNYQLLKNLNQMNNSIILENLNLINLDNNFINKFTYILNLYDKIVNDNKMETYNNGNKYFGQIRNGLRNGKGKMYYLNGSQYDGEWKDDLFEGKGILYNSNGDKYEGDWKKDKKEGKGILYCFNGDRYEGYFKNNEMEGKGTYYYKNGDKYIGEWINGRKGGKGIFYWNHGDRYEGDWKNGKMDGKGIYYYNNGKWKGDRYEGDWKKDKREGSGIYYRNNGDRQMGDYLNDICVGIHIRLSKDGEITKKDYNQKNP